MTNVQNLVAQAWHAAVIRISPVLPPPLRRQLVPRTYAWGFSDLHRVARSKPGQTRLLIGRTNSASQANHWARAAETIEGVSAVSMAFGWDPNTTRLPADVVIPRHMAQRSRVWALNQRRALLDGFTHVIYESARPILGPLYPDLESEIADLRANGIKVAMVSHGSDVRTPSVHLELEPYSPFAESHGGLTQALEEKAVENHDVLDNLGLGLFVSTPDQLLYRPEGTWLPTLTDPERWGGLPSAELGTHKLRVLHIPSTSALKGTVAISPAMKKLEREGYIEYLEATGVPNEDMPALVGQADLVVDQMGIGAYGVASLEAMLARRLVVAQVGEHIRDHIRQQTGWEVPIIEANADTVYDRVKEVAQDPQAFTDRLDQGYQFVREVHGEEQAANVLRPFLTS